MNVVAVAVPRPAADAFGVFERWLAAVDRHAPSLRDDSLAWVAGLSRAERADLIDYEHVFGGFLRDPAHPQLRRPTRKVGASDVQMILREAVLRKDEVNPFLHRAAVLHADAVVLAEERTDAANAASRPASFRGSSEEVILVDDGQFHSTRERNWHWQFGRQVLDDVKPAPQDDEFVTRWYHATTAFMLANGRLAEATPHLQRADAVFLYDPRIVFDRACLSETFGLAQVQSVMTSGTLKPGFRPDVPPEASANATAENLFRRVLELDPSYVEARVRLGRLAEVRGSGAEAVQILAPALKEGGDRVLSYYAWMFAGRAEQSVGHFDLAMSHFSRAATLFPQAQTAWLAMSYAAAMSGNMTSAGAPIDLIRKMALSRDERDDPWWEYSSGAGRDRVRLFEDLRKAVRR